MAYAIRFIWDVSSLPCWSWLYMSCTCRFTLFLLIGWGYIISTFFFFKYLIVTFLISHELHLSLPLPRLELILVCLWTCSDCLQHGHPTKPDKMRFHTILNSKDFRSMAITAPGYVIRQIITLGAVWLQLFMRYDHICLMLFAFLLGDHLTWMNWMSIVTNFGCHGLVSLIQIRLAIQMCVHFDHQDCRCRPCPKPPAPPTKSSKPIELTRSLRTQRERWCLQWSSLSWGQKMQRLHAISLSKFKHATRTLTKWSKIMGNLYQSEPVPVRWTPEEENDKLIERELLRDCPLLRSLYIRPTYTRQSDLPTLVRKVASITDMKSRYL
jgi:hypothetical protein